MAGRPLLAQINAQLAQLAGENFDLPEDWLFAQVADGTSLKKLAKQLGCSRPYLYVWRDEAPHAERRREKWARALKASADAHLEDGKDILDDLANQQGVLISAPEVSLATSRANYRQKTAAMRDPDRFGERKGGTVVNIGSLHLSALLARGSVSKVQAEASPAALPSGEDVVEADFEIETREDDVLAELMEG